MIVRRRRRWARSLPLEERRRQTVARRDCRAINANSWQKGRMALTTRLGGIFKRERLAGLRWPLAAAGRPIAFPEPFCRPCVDVWASGREQGAAPPIPSSPQPATLPISPVARPSTIFRVVMPPRADAFTASSGTR